MPEFCTCGAQLPPDALFCHKCGKPQRDIVTPEIEPNTYPAAVEASVAPPPPAPRLQPLPLNFHNPIAVRIALRGRRDRHAVELPANCQLAGRRVFRGLLLLPQNRFSPGWRRARKSAGSPG